MRFSSPAKRRLVIGLAGAAAAAALLQFGGWLLMREGLLTFIFDRALTPRVLRSATSTPELPPPFFVDRTRPLAVMIDNHPGALPQSGLAEADIVWEAPVEGGLTRLMAVYRSTAAVEIGPVRSARPYFLDWAREADAVYAHVGGSDEALEILHVGALGLDDANEFRHGAFFWRDRGRPAPHNAYTSTEKMRSLIVQKGWREKTEAVDASLRSDVAPKDAAPAMEISVRHIAGDGGVSYRWDASRGGFVRAVRGREATTRGGETLAPPTVVVIETGWKKVRDPYGKGLIGLETLGAGRAKIFRDGQAYNGTWKKASPQEPTELFGPDGKKIPFREGPVWIHVIAANKGGAASHE